MLRTTCLAIVVILITACGRVPQVSPGDERPAFSLQTASGSTLRVVASDGRGRRTGVASGSGVVVAPNLVLTNLHVIQPYYESADGYLFVMENTAGYPREVNAIVASDPRLDMALLYVRGMSSQPAPLALAVPRQLEPVTALGFPGATDEIFGRFRDSVSATSGQVTAVDDGPVGDYGPIQLIVHTATVNPGNSGGPLFNACGEVVGINTLKADPAQASNVFVASSVTEIAGFLESMGVQPTTAQHVCLPANPASATPCTYNRAELDETISNRDLDALDAALREIPDNCPAVLDQAWSARRTLQHETIAAFLAMSGSWRLPEQRCTDRVVINLSGSAIWGASGTQSQFERLAAISDGAVTTRTVFPMSNNPAEYRYRLVGDRLKIENLTTHSEWEMERCSG